VTVVAVAQLPLTVGDVDGNRGVAAEAVAGAAAGGAGLVILPELSDSGYVFTGEAEARALAAPAGASETLSLWRALAARHRTVIAGGFCELGADGRLYNSAAIVDASGTRAVYRKAHLWDAEKLVFTAGGARPPVVDLPCGRVALLICYDLEFPEWVRLAALSGADLIAAPVNWPAAPRPSAERPAEVVKAQADAAVNGVFVAVADRCRAERGAGWIGGSVIIGPDGYPLAGPASDGAAADGAASDGAGASDPDSDGAGRFVILTADCDLHRARDKRASSRNDLLADRRCDLYGGSP
jgi:5-aminopentanamidase